MDDGRWETVERKGKGRSAGEIGLGGVGSRRTCEREMRRTRADMHADCPSNGTGGMKNGAGVGEARSGKAPISWQTVNGVDSANPSHLDDIFSHLFIRAHERNLALALSLCSRDPLLGTTSPTVCQYIMRQPPAVSSRKASGEMLQTATIRIPFKTANP